MTVYIEATRNSGTVVKGAIKKLGGIVAIEEYDEYVRFIVNSSKEHLCAKDTYKLISVEMKGGENGF